MCGRKTNAGFSSQAEPYLGCKAPFEFLWAIKRVFTPVSHSSPFHPGCPSATKHKGSWKQPCSPEPRVEPFPAIGLQNSLKQSGQL